MAPDAIDRAGDEHQRRTLLRINKSLPAAKPRILPKRDFVTKGCTQKSAAAPGNPLHVLLSDEIAEHVPGCTMAYRKEALLAIDGFDTRFRAVGDDVDLCWRLQGTW